jgi:hypothetical protein
MYDLSSLKNLLTTAKTEEEKKSVNRKIEAVKKNIVILESVIPGSDYYARLEKKIRTDLEWEPGKPVRESVPPSVIINQIFGDKDTVYTRTILVVSDEPIPENLSVPGCRIFPKDTDKVRVNYRYPGKPEIIQRNRDKLVLRKELIPSGVVPATENGEEEEDGEDGTGEDGGPSMDV